MAKLKASFVRPGDFKDATTLSERALVSTIPILKLYAISLRRSSDQADDLVQETLERAWKNRLKFSEGASLKGWLFSIMRNASIDGWRRHKLTVEDPGGLLAARLVALPDQPTRIEYTDMLAALSTMPNKMRAALLLIALGATHGEAAVLMGCPLGTLKSRVQRGRAELIDKTTKHVRPPVSVP